MTISIQTAEQHIDTGASHQIQSCYFTALCCRTALTIVVIFCCGVVLCCVVLCCDAQTVVGDCQFAAVEHIYCVRTCIVQSKKQYASFLVV